MKSFSFGGCMLGAFAAAAMLAGCGGSPRPSERKARARTITHFRTIRRSITLVASVVYRTAQRNAAHGCCPRGAWRRLDWW